MAKVEIGAQIGTAAVVAARILGKLPDILTCVGMLMTIVLTYWLVRKARAKTMLTERECRLKDIEIERKEAENEALREQGRRIIEP